MSQSKRRTIPIIAICLTLLVCFTVNTQIANADQITDGQDTTSDCKSLPSSISVVDASSDVSKAPVVFSSNTFNLNFTAYCNPVDIYFAILTPDNKLIFTDSNGKLTLDYEPYTAGAKSAVNKSFSVADSALATEIEGKCVLYWLVSPANGGEILNSVESGTYELGFYPIDGADTNAFKVVSVEAEKDEPFAPVKINITGMDKQSFDFKKARVYFNDIEVPVYSVDDDLQTVQVFIPYVLGEAGVSFYDGKHLTSNKITVTINKTILSDTEIKAVESKVINELETMIADVQTHSSQQNLSAESKNAYAEIEKEINLNPWHAF
ncbi:MAG: hypothetical protein HQK67_11015 [Desulfamplus sp.]|nr:hypothetical protein [Desulfamplus sp.]